MRISDWSSDVCSSDLTEPGGGVQRDEVVDPLIEGVPGRRELGGAALHLHRSVDPEGDEDRRSDVDEGEESWTLGGRGAPVARLGAGAPNADGRACRSSERRVGKECFSPFKSRWSPCHANKNAY